MPLIQAIWAARVDGEEIRLIEELSWESADESILAWTSPETFVTMSWEGGGIGSMFYHIRELNIRSNSTQLIYEGKVESADFRAESQALVFTQGVYSDLPTGIFLVNAKSLDIQQVDDQEWDQIMWIPGTQWFGTQSWFEKRVVLFTEQGLSIDLFPNEYTLPSVSPDGNWLVFFGPNNIQQNGIRLYDRQGNLIHHIAPNHNFKGQVYWKPDSSGFWFFENFDPGFGDYRDIFEYSFSNDEISVFDLNLATQFQFNWLIGIIPAQD